MTGVQRAHEIQGVPSTMVVTLATRVLSPIDLPALGFRDTASERMMSGLAIVPRSLCRKPNMLGSTSISLTAVLQPNGRLASDLQSWDPRLEIVEVYDYGPRLSALPRIVNAIHRVARGGPMIGNVHARRTPPD